jgi:hypothetical protein
MRGMNAKNFLYGPRQERLTNQTSPEEKIARMPCSRCNDTGWYMYDNHHSTVCPDCCKCDQGWWLLTVHHGADPGKLTWCCKAGCGRKLSDEELNCQHPDGLDPSESSTGVPRWECRVCTGSMSETEYEAYTNGGTKRLLKALGL